MEYEPIEIRSQAVPQDGDTGIQWRRLAATTAVAIVVGLLADVASPVALILLSLWAGLAFRQRPFMHGFLVAAGLFVAATVAALSMPLRMQRMAIEYAAYAQEVAYPVVGLVALWLAVGLVTALLHGGGAWAAAKTMDRLLPRSDGA